MTPHLRSMTSLYITDDHGVLCLFRIGSKIADQLYVGTAGGHFETDELNNPLACVLREAREELNLTADELTDLKMRYITMRLKNDEIRQNYYFSPVSRKTDRFTAMKAALNGFLMKRFLR